MTNSNKEEIKAQIQNNHGQIANKLIYAFDLYVETDDRNVLRKCKNEIISNLFMRLLTDCDINDIRIFLKTLKEKNLESFNKLYRLMVESRDIWALLPLNHEFSKYIKPIAIDAKHKMIDNATLIGHFFNFSKIKNDAITSNDPAKKVDSKTAQRSATPYISDIVKHQDQARNWTKVIRLLAKHVDYSSVLINNIELATLDITCAILLQVTSKAKKYQTEDNKEYFRRLAKSLMSGVIYADMASQEAITLKGALQNDLLNLERLNKKAVGLYCFAIAASTLALICVDLKYNSQLQFSTVMTNFMKDMDILTQLTFIEQMFGNLDNAITYFTLVAAATGLGYTNMMKKEMNKSELQLIESAILNAESNTKNYED